MIERLSSGGCRVRQLEPADIADTIRLRGLLEGAALRRAAECGARVDQLRRCDEIVAAIDAALGPSGETVDFDRYADLNTEFHNAFVDLCESDVLQREYARISRLPMAAPSSFLPAQAASPQIRQSLFQAQAQHRAMLEAVRAREGSRAEALAREHAHLAETNLQAILGDRATYQSKVPGLALVASEPMR